MKVDELITILEILIHAFFHCLQKRKAQDEEVEKIQNERKTQNRTFDRFLP